MLHVYISGPIAGHPNGNKEAFAAETRWLNSLYAPAELFSKTHPEPISATNPHSISAYAHEGECPQGYSNGNGHSSACWLRADLIELLKCDAMIMLEDKDWHNSVGAKLEREVAQKCGIPIFENKAHFMAYYQISEEAETQAEIEEFLS